MGKREASRRRMSSDEEQTQQVTRAATQSALAEASHVPGAGAARPGGADPLASTLSMRPQDAPVPQRKAAEVGRELGAVRLLREIGRGATGSVFLGHHTVLGRDVAVKFLVNVRSSGQDGLKRFLDEARAAAAVRHPNLTQIYHADVDDADGTPYLVLEYVRGPTLKQLLDLAGALDLAAAVAVLCDAAAAVHELHLQGLIHRDIKPSNVLLDKDGHVFVTDFGLAVRQQHGAAGAGAGSGTGHTSEFAGTPAYMAPEMFDGRMSARSDVYALGVTVFQLLTGRVPYSGSFDDLRDRHAKGPLPSDELRSRGVPPEVVEVLERATHKQPMFRYKTPLDFARGLKQAARVAEAELARARKKLCETIAAGRGTGTGLASVSSSLPTMSVAGGLGTTSDADDPPSSTTYPEMLSRFATIRRGRRTHVPATADPHGTRPQQVPVRADLAAPAPLASAPLTPTLAPSLGPALDPSLPDEPGPVVVPGPVLAVAVLGIIYGALVAGWYVGEATGSVAAALPGLGPEMKATPLSVAAWRVLIGVAGVTLTVVLVAASAGCFRMKSWARKLMVRYAAVDLVFQVFVLLTVFAWAGPTILNATNPKGPTPTTVERATRELHVYINWTVRWLALSVFPAMALAVMTRRAGRDAFPARPSPEDSPPPPPLASPAPPSEAIA
jgi:serine/threonine protein kinase